MLLARETKNMADIFYVLYHSESSKLDSYQIMINRLFLGTAAEAVVMAASELAPYSL